MNRKNLLRLADFIEQHKAKSVGFNMSTYADDDSHPDSDRSGHECKTVACIAGHGFLLAEGYRKITRDRASRMAWGFPGVYDDNAGSAFSVSKEFLDLTEDEAREMFVMYNYFGSTSMDDITAGDAVKLLRNAAETGKVDWYKVLGEENPHDRAE